MRYTAKPREVSIVDNPCMYGAKFSLVKANGVLEEKRFHNTASPELRQVMNETGEKLEILRKRITEILEQRAAVSSPTRFNPLDKDALAQVELRKALANPKPAHFDNEGTSVFKTVESVAPGVQMYSKTIPVAAAEVATEVRARTKFEPRGYVGQSFKRAGRRPASCKKNLTLKRKMKCHYQQILQQFKPHGRKPRRNSLSLQRTQGPWRPISQRSKDRTTY